MDFIGKKYRMVSSENFDEFMKVLEKGKGGKIKIGDKISFKMTNKVFELNIIKEQLDKDYLDKETNSSTCVGIFVRKMIGAATPTVELKKEGDWYILVTHSAVRTMEARFQPGVEKDEKRPDGSPIKTIFEFEGNTLKQVERAPDGTEVVYIREFGPEEMTAISAYTGTDEAGCGHCTYTVEFLG